MRAQALAAAAALLLGGCGPKIVSPLPPGVIVPGAKPGALTDGIYAKRPGESDCCWADREARFRVAKPGRDTDFMLHVYVPDVAPYRRSPQSLSVSIDGYRSERCCLKPGMHTLLLRLPPALQERTGTIGVTVRAGRWYVPEREGIGTDPRRLAYVIVSADFTSFMGGRI